MRFLVVPLLILNFLAGGMGCSKTRGTSRAKLDSIAQVYEHGDTETAAEQLQEYLKSYPRDDLAWTILGNAYEDMDQDTTAETAYAKAIEINPKRYEAISGMGILCRKKREYDRAGEYYKRAIAIDPKYAQAYSSMSMVLIKQKNYKEALRYAQQAYDLERTDPDIVANLAAVCRYNGMTVQRDKLTQDAERLGYKKCDTLRKIYRGEMTLED
ncbi:MAG: tetratricopeptide repeat protein [Pirellulaceae bacterium]